MKIFLHYLKSKPYRVGAILAGDPAKPNAKTNQKLGIYQPKSEGRPEKTEIDISKYDALLISGVKATDKVTALRLTIEPPPPSLEPEVTEEEAPAETESAEAS